MCVCGQADWCPGMLLGCCIPGGFLIGLRRWWVFCEGGERGFSADGGAQNFTTFATPHLGVRTPLRGWHNHIWYVSSSGLFEYIVLMVDAGT